MARLPSSLLDSVVAIGRLSPSMGDLGDIDWIGTGFLVADVLQRDTHAGDFQYRLYLVTNRHVVEPYENVLLKFGWESEASETHTLRVDASARPDGWFFHPDMNVDVAIVPLSALSLHGWGIQFSALQSDREVLTLAGMAQRGVGEGDPVFLMGFPLGKVGSRRPNPIVRWGCVARIRDTLAREVSEFLIDAAVFPGNSGAPVVAPVKVADGEDIRLIGIVQGYVPYRDRAVSEQSGRTLIILEDNSGLASVLPYDAIEATIALHRRLLPVSQGVQVEQVQRSMGL